MSPPESALAASGRPAMAACLHGAAMSALRNTSQWQPIKIHLTGKHWQPLSAPPWQPAGTGPPGLLLSSRGMLQPSQAGRRCCPGAGRQLAGAGWQSAPAAMLQGWYLKAILCLATHVDMATVRSAAVCAPAGPHVRAVRFAAVKHTARSIPNAIQHRRPVCSGDAE